VFGINNNNRESLVSIKHKERIKETRETVEFYGATAAL